MRSRPLAISRTTFNFKVSGSGGLKFEQFGTVDRGKYAPAGFFLI